jgi:hypothetical protein
MLNIIPSRYRPRVREMVKGLRNELSGHYAIPLATPVAYCYIRKNACSAFRRMILEHSPHPKRKDERPVFYMDRCHRLGYGDIAGCAHVIFVIRDPFERAVSGYLQQIVSRLDEPYPVLEDGVRGLTGRTRAELSFADFVEFYLGTEDFSRIDVHFMPQVAHLAPIRYSDVLLDKRLAEDAAQVFGPALAEQVTLMFDLIALAFQADLTRVVSYIMVAEGTNRTYNHIGIPDAFHPVSHHANDLERIEKLVRIQTWHVEKFSEFVARMAATPDGDGSLLDHAIFLYGSNMSKSDLHNNYPVPNILVGGGNGRMRMGGQHIVLPERTPIANLHLTLLQKVGMEREFFSDSTGVIAEV